jgi:hypothetical protein
MTNTRIKIKIGNSYDFAELIFSGSEITFKYGSYSVTAKGDYPFMVLKKVREELDEKGIMLIINASRKDVYPSGLSLVGNNAYVQTIGKPTSLKDLVNIFEETDKAELLGTVDEQSKYHADWVNSLQ